MDNLEELQHRIHNSVVIDYVFARKIRDELVSLRHQNQRMQDIIDEYNKRLMPLLPILLAISEKDNKG